MNNIIECKLESTYKEIFTGLWQHDYGQILRITGVEFPKAVEIQFSLNEKSGSTITRIGTTVDGATEVQIPNELLKNDGRTYDYCIYAYIYLTDETSGSTEYEIVLHVKSRTKPENPSEEPLPEPNIFHETVAAVNASAERAETAEKNAKASEVEAGKYAASASESAGAAEKTKEDALKEVGEKKREAIEAIREQEETSVRKIINHTDNEIQRIQNQIANSKGELEQTIENASASNEELEQSIETASDTKTALDESTELAETAKTELDTSTQKAGEAKNALDESIEIAGTVNETLSATVKQAGALDTSLGEKIKTGTQLKTDLTASGEKAVQDIQTAGSEQLGKMQAVAEEFTADREQITTNKEDISSLKDEMNKNFLDDAKTKRSLDALWKLNQGISYQFETDIEKAYQKDIPSGAKLVSVKKIGGRTIVWNQMLKLLDSSNWTARGTGGSIEIADGECIVRDCASTWGGAVIAENLKILQTHKYYISLYGRVLNNGDSITIAVAETFPVTEIGVINSTTAYRVSKIVEASESLEAKFAFGNSKNTYDYAVSNFMLIDLTKMFGEGNEPSTPEEFEALFPEDYYPYNEGTIMSIPVNEVVEKGRNQLPDRTEIGKFDGITFVRNGDGSLTVSGTSTSSRLRLIGNAPVEKGKKYKLTGAPVGGSSKSYRLWVASILAFPEGKRLFDTGSGGEATALEDEIISVNIQVMKGVTVKDLTFRPMLTYADTEGDFSPYHKNTYPIPQAILNLDGYGDGVSDDVYNYVDWEEKKYHKRVGRVDLGSLTWTAGGKYGDYFRYNAPSFLISSLDSIGNTLCAKFNRALVDTEVEGYGFHGIELYLIIQTAKYSTNTEFAQAMQGVMLYYELAEEQIIDISDIIDATFQEPIEVETGGTLTFQNSNGDGYQLPIPNEEEYIVSLAEVGGGANE
nr:MAG TPA: chromosome segregation protein [Caudoviricetes sp.]